MKLCKDCKWIDKEEEFCLSPKLPTVSPVTGEKVEDWFCEPLRDRPWFCGPDAKWFEPKAPDPGEGWRFLKPNYDQFVIGDEGTVDAGKTWGPNPVGMIGHTFHEMQGVFYRRRITPKLERCPEGHRPSLFQVEPGQFAIRCLCAGHRDHWRVDDTSEQMVRDRWNATMRAMRIASKLAEALRPLLDGIYSHSDFENAQKALKEWDSQNNP